MPLAGLCCPCGPKGRVMTHVTPPPWIRHCLTERLNVEQGDVIRAMNERLQAPTVAEFVATGRGLPPDCSAQRA